MLAPSLQRRMNLLALVAMLLLLVLPTTGRLMTSATGALDDGAWVCTMAGLKLVKFTAGDSNPLDPEPDPPSPGGDGMAGMDCVYCLTLAGMAVLLLCLAFGIPPGVRSPPLPWRLMPSRAFAYPSGLGSRGPPIAL